MISLNLIFRNWVATLLVLVTCLSVFLFDTLYFDIFPNINYFNMVIELSVALISLIFFFAIQKYQNTPFYKNMSIGLYLFFLSYYVDAIDQIFIHSILFTVVFEKIALISAIVFLYFGGKQWITNFESLSLIDELTQIPNRKLFRATVQKEMHQCLATNIDFCLAIIDVDYFKRVNDEYGHSIGDKVLNSFAQLISNSIKKGDVVGRWGGEEFILLLRGSDIIKGKTYAEEIKTVIESYNFIFNYKPINITCSIGISQWQKGVDEFETLFNKADGALFNAKKSGRNQVKIH